MTGDDRSRQRWPPWTSKQTTSTSPSLAILPILYRRSGSGLTPQGRKSLPDTLSRARRPAPAAPSALVARPRRGRQGLSGGLPSASATCASIHSVRARTAHCGRRGSDHWPPRWTISTGAVAQVLARSMKAIAWRCASRTIPARRSSTTAASVGRSIVSDRWPRGRGVRINARRAAGTRPGSNAHAAPSYRFWADGEMASQNGAQCAAVLARRRVRRARFSAARLHRGPQYRAGRPGP